MRHQQAYQRADLVDGILAGAVGTLAREAASNLDMAIRARSASDSHERTVQRLADLTRVDLGGPDRAPQRRAGFAPVLGFVNGIVAATLLTVLAERGRTSLPVTAGLLGAGAMLFADTEMTALGTTDPERWGVQGWVTDLIPYLAYGLAAAATLHRLSRGRPARR